MCKYVYIFVFLYPLIKRPVILRTWLSSVGKSTGHVLTPVIWRTAQKLRIRVAHDMIILCMCVKTSMEIVWTSHLNTWTSRKAPSLKKHFTITLISRIPALDKGSFKWNTSIIYCQESMLRRYFSCPTFWPYFREFRKRMNEGPQNMSDTFGRVKEFNCLNESRCCKSPHVYKWLYRLIYVIYVYTPLFTGFIYIQQMVTC